MEAIKLDLQEGEKLLDRLLASGADIAHDCGGALACSSCRVVVREGLERLAAATGDELDMLDRAGAAAPGARLACQAMGAGELVVEIPHTQAPVPAVVVPLSVSPPAAKHLALQLAKHRGAVGVRLSVAPAGCAGFRYRIDPTDAIREEDSVFEAGNVRLVVDAASLPYLHGTTIDLAQEGLARRLRFDNPNVRESCGCGESFGV